MTDLEFQGQISRLAEQFGKTAYSTERMKLIWREVRDFPVSWLAKVVDRFIGEFRTPPLMTEFREEISRERERQVSIQRRQHAADAKEFWSSYSKDDISSICETIVGRMKNSVSDEEFKKYISALEYTADEVSRSSSRLGEGKGSR